MSDGEPPTVLIADDEPAIVDGQASRLERQYRIRRAYGGREALERLDETVDVALLDRRMPDLSGDEVLERLRSEGYSCRVAMLTGVEPSFDIAEMGFDDYIRKPVDEASLFEVVENLIARQAYDAGLREFYSVARRVALLEADHDQQELDGNEAYQRLLDRRQVLRSRLDDTLEELRATEGYAVAVDDIITDGRTDREPCAGGD
jgi:two-component system response regulator AdeR